MPLCIEEHLVSNLIIAVPVIMAMYDLNGKVHVS